MAPTSGFYSILKIAVLTFAGAFLGALTLTGTVPTTLHGLAQVTLPALGAAIAAEVYYLRSEIAKLLAQLGQTPPTPSTTAKTDPPAAARGFAGLEVIFGTLAVAVTGMVLMALAAFLSGCAADPAVVPVTPANASAISSCQGIEAARGDIVIGDFTFTGAAAVLGGVAAGLPASNVNGRTDFAIAAAGSAGVAGVLTGLTAFETSAFTNGQCQQYLGPLPASPFGNKTTVTVTPSAGQ